MKTPTQITEAIDDAIEAIESLAVNGLTDAEREHITTLREIQGKAQAIWAFFAE